jgi:hypothetical protein
LRSATAQYPGIHQTADQQIASPVSDLGTVTDHVEKQQSTTSREKLMLSVAQSRNVERKPGAKIGAVQLESKATLRQARG